VKLYEGMFLIDNAEVRSDWNSAKALVTGVLEKHGAAVRTARRWAERRLAYPIEKKKRATYLLTYFEAPPEASDTIRRDLDLSEKVLRYLILSAGAVPEKELELSQAEQAEGFTIPPPPDDDFQEPDTELQADFEPEEGRPRRRRERSDDDDFDVEELMAGAGASEED
jgi:small subunit ribosomal protein S6